LGDEDDEVELPVGVEDAEIRLLNVAETLAVVKAGGCCK
jgi:hypothetical protein